MGIGLDLLSASEISGPRFGKAFDAAVEKGSTPSELRDLREASIDPVLDLGGLVPWAGVVPDALSMVRNFGQNTHISYGP